MTGGRRSRRRPGRDGCNRCTRLHAEVDGHAAQALTTAGEQLQLDLDARLHELAASLARDASALCRFRVCLPSTRQGHSHPHHEQIARAPGHSQGLFPPFTGPGRLAKWHLQENLPGHFPFTAGIYPFKREGEDPTRMFAGEGGPERTNKRFHYVSLGMPAKRLSTAFDSVTLYGFDPDLRPDIYGKVGNSG